MAAFSPLRAGASALALALFLTACGGGDGGDGEDHPPRSIGGSVTGLTGSGLVLQNNSGNDLSIGASGTFVFAATVPDGNSYAVTVRSQPSNPSQSCAVSAGTGTARGSDVTNVAVTCTTNTYTVAGTISGLSGTGLTLRNNGGDDLTPTGNGAFQFSTRIASNSPFAVTVRDQPIGPWQTCEVAGGSGIVTSADVTGVTVTCTLNRYELAGTVSGMSRRLSRFRTPLVLSNGSDEVAVSQDGSFRMPAGTLSGNAYAVAVRTAPDKPPMDCTIANGAGQTTNADVSNIAVSCVRSQGKLAVVASYISRLSSYRIEATGELTPAHVLQIGSGARSVALDPSGQFAYVQVMYPAAGIEAYAVNSATGAMTAVGAAVPNIAQPVQIAVDPTSTYLFSANQYGGATSQGSVTAYRIDPTTGALTEIDTYTINYNPKGLAIDPSGRFVYVATSTYTTAALSIDPATGVLTALPGSPFSNGTSMSAVPWSIAADPLGRFIYTVNSSSTVGITGFLIDASLGTLQILPGAPYGVYADNRLTVDPHGEFLFLANYTYPNYDIAGYSIDPSTGNLAARWSAPYHMNAGARDLAFEPGGKFFYATGYLGIKGFQLNRQNGNLAALPGSPYPLEGEGDSIALY